MYINKPSATKIEAADRVNLCIVLSIGLNSGNHEKLVKYLCLYPCPDLPKYPHFHESPKRLLLSDIQLKH